MANLGLELIIKAKDQASAALDAIKNSMGGLTKEAGQASNAMQKLAGTFGGAANDVSNIDALMKKLGLSSTAALKEAARDARDSFLQIKNSGSASAADIERAFQAYAQKAIAANNGVISSTLKLEAANHGLSVAIDKNGKAVASSSAEIAGAFDRQGGAASGLISKIVALGGAYVSLQGFKSAIGAILDTGGKFESLGKQMAAVMGSIEGGQKATEWVKAFAKDTPFELEGVSQAFIKLKAMGMDPMDGTLQALADQTAKLGGDQQALEGIVLGVGQAWTKQKLQAEEANQLIERGVPVWELLSKATGKTTQELMALSEAGKLGRAEIKLLVNEIGKSSAGASASMMTTWAGMISNLKDTWAQFLDTIAQSGALDYFKSQLDGLLQKTQQMAASGELQRVAKNISDFFVSTAASVKDVIGAIAEFGGAIKNVAVVLAGVKLAGFADTLRNALAGGFTTAAGAATGFAGALAKVTQAAGVAVYAALVAEILKVVDAYKQLKLQNVQLEQSEKDRDATQAKLAQRYAELSQQTGIVIRNQADLNKAIQSGALVFDQASGAYTKAAGGLRDYDAEVQQAAKAQKSVVDSQIEIGAAADKALEKFKALKGGAKDLKDELHGLSDKELKELSASLQTAWDAGINKTAQAKEALNAISGETMSRIVDKFGDMGRSADEWASTAAAGLRQVMNSGQYTTEQLERMKRAIIENAQSATELQALDREFQKEKISIYDATATAELYSQKLDQLREKTDILTSSSYNLDKAQQQLSNTYAQKLAAEEQALQLEAQQQQAAEATAAAQSVAYSRMSAVLNDTVNAARSKLKAYGAAWADVWRAAAPNDGVFGSWTTFFNWLGDGFNKVKKQAEDFNNAVASQVASQLKGSGEAAAGTLNTQKTLQQQLLSGLTSTATTLTNKTTAAFQSIKNSAFVNTTAMLGDLAHFLNGTADAGDQSKKGLQDYISWAEQAVAAGDKLSQQNLDALNKSIDEAKQKLADMAERSSDAQGTLAGLQDQWDELNNNKDAIDQRHYAAERLALEEKLKQAQADKNSEEIAALTQSIALLDKIHKAQVAAGKAATDGAQGATDAAAAADAQATATVVNLAQSAASASAKLSALKDQWDQLNGNTAAIELRDYLEQRITLEQQLADTRAAGDRLATEALSESLRTLDAIHAKKLEISAAEAEQLSAAAAKAASDAAAKALAEEAAKAEREQAAAAAEAAQHVAEMERNTQSALGTLGNLRDEWDRLNNNNAAAEQRHYMEQRLELEQQLETAKANANDAEVAALSEAIGLLDQINAKKAEIATTAAAQAEADAAAAVAAEKLKTETAEAAAHMAELKRETEGAQNTLTSLRNEWDRLNNNSAAIEQRDYAARRLEIEQQLAAAQTANNADAIATLTESLVLLDQIHAKKTEAIATETAAQSAAITSAAVQHVTAVTGAAASGLAGITKAVEEKLYDVTGKSVSELQAFISQSEKALQNADALDKAKIDNLTRSIEAAKREIELLQSRAEQAAGGFASLQDQWDQLNGDQASIEARRYNQQKAELEKKLKTAQTDKNTQEVEALQNSLKLLEQIYQKKRDMAAAEAKAAADKAAADKAAAAAAAAGSAPGKAATPGQLGNAGAENYGNDKGVFGKVRFATIQLNGPNGGAPVEAHFTNDADAQKLIDMLRQSGLRTSN